MAAETSEGELAASVDGTIRGLHSHFRGGRAANGRTYGLWIEQAFVYVGHSQNHKVTVLPAAPR